jgi:uncharacterized protein YjbI with pentapeptide repeats
VDLTSPWTIGGVAIALLAAAVIPGVYLWWPSRTQELAKSDLGLALMTGAVIAFSILFLEFLLVHRTTKVERQRQDEAEHQALQLLVGRQHVLSGIDLGCSANEDGTACGETLDDFYLNGKILQGANLRGSSLRRARLQDANLEEADMERANLRYARLEHADLDRAVLDRATLDDANLRFADLSGARLHGTLLRRADLSFAVLRADLAEARLFGARLFGADLTNANLRRARLVDADLRSATLAGANLVGANLSRAKVEGVDFHGAKYDSTTTWANGRKRPCDDPPCRRRGTARNDAEAAVAALRDEFARCLPAGWAVLPRDPHGFTFQSSIHGALFYGERYRRLAGEDLLAYANANRDSLRRNPDLPGLREYEFRKAPIDDRRARIDVTGTRVVIFHFDHLESGSGGRQQRWERLEVYAYGREAAYRFGGMAPADTFMLFDRDFGQLLSALGLDPRDAFPSVGSDFTTCGGRGA